MKNSTLILLIFLLSGNLIFPSSKSFSEQDPQNPNYSQNREAAKRYFDEGAEYAKKGQAKEAISAFQKAIEKDPEDSGVYLNMGIVYSALGQKEEAVAALEKAEMFAPAGSLEGTPKDKFFLIIGHFYRQLGDNNNAINILKKSLELNPRSEGSYYQLSDIYFHSGMYNDAIQNCIKAMEINPNNGHVLFLLGASQEKIGNHEEAMVNFKKALEAYKNNNENESAKIVKDVLRKFGVK